MNAVSNAIRVELSSSEYLQAMQVGIMRSCEDRKKNRGHAYGARREDAEMLDIRGAVGEAVVAKHLNVYWLGTGRFGGDDVGQYQVRSSGWNPPFLCAHPKDIDDKPYISVYVCEGVGLIYGWMLGAEAKQPRYWADKWNNKRPAFWVPHDHLRPMEELPR